MKEKRKSTRVKITLSDHVYGDLLAEAERQGLELATYARAVLGMHATRLRVDAHNERVRQDEIKPRGVI